MTARAERSERPGAATPHDVRLLVHGPVETITHVDTLLYLRAAAPAARSLADIAAAVRIPLLPVVRRCLDDLTAGGLIARGAVRDDYRYVPRSDRLRTCVDALVDMREHRSATLSRVLHCKTGH